MYNNLEAKHGHARMSLFLALVDFCAACKRSDLVHGRLASLGWFCARTAALAFQLTLLLLPDALVASWGVKTAEARPVRCVGWFAVLNFCRQLYRAVNRLLAESGNGPAALKQQVPRAAPTACAADAWRAP